MADLISIGNDLLKHCDIVEVISKYCKVVKKGNVYQTLCPFHDDKTLGNFSISQSKQIFKCFSCGEAGNAIQFVKKIENCSYLEALKIISEICNYPIEELNSSKFTRKKSDEEEEMFRCVDKINSFYKAALFNSEEGKNRGLNYLNSRNLDRDIITYFDIGYSLSDGQNAIKFLKANSISNNLIQKCGISKKVGDNLLDINSGRVTFGIRNSDGEIVGFSSRKLEKDDDSSKYMNTTSTKIFDKSSILYNYHNAKREVSKTKTVYVLEGFMDVIALHKINRKNAVALMGTALTKKHISLLKALKCEIILCLDLDLPGQKNTLSHIEELTKEGLKVKVVNNLKDLKFKDCDDILSNLGDKVLNEYLDDVVSIGDWILNYYSKYTNLNDVDNKKRLINRFFKFLLNVEDDFEKEDYLIKLAKKISFPYDYLKNKLDEVLKNKQKEDNLSDDLIKTHNLELSKKEKKKIDIIEQKILYYLLHNKEAYAIIDSQISLFRENLKKIHSVINKYIDQYPLKGITPDDIILFLESTDVKDSSLICKQINDIKIEQSRMVEPYNSKLFKELIAEYSNELELEKTNTKIGKLSGLEQLNSIVESKKAKINRLKNQNEHNK